MISGRMTSFFCRMYFLRLFTQLNLPAYAPARRLPSSEPVRWVSPLPRWGLLAGKTLSVLIVEVLQIGLLTAVAFVFVLKLVPETKGRSLEQIEADLKVAAQA